MSAVSPHEAFFTPDGKEVWVTIRGEDLHPRYSTAATYEPTKRRIKGAERAGHDHFFAGWQVWVRRIELYTPEMVVIDTKTHRDCGQPSSKSQDHSAPSLAATPDGKQVWITLEGCGQDSGHQRTSAVRDDLATLDSGAITNHVNIAATMRWGQFAYVTVGGLNAVKVDTTTDHPELVATIPTGEMPHGLWPSGDGTRMYVGLKMAMRLRPSTRLPTRCSRPSRPDSRRRAWSISRTRSRAVRVRIT